MKLGRKSCDSVLEKTCVSFQSNLTYQQFFVKLTNIDRKLYTSFRLPCYRLQREFSLCMCNIINKTSENEDFIASCKLRISRLVYLFLKIRRRRWRRKKQWQSFFPSWRCHYLSFSEPILSLIFCLMQFAFILAAT